MCVCVCVRPSVLPFATVQFYFVVITHNPGLVHPLLRPLPTAVRDAYVLCTYVYAYPQPPSVYHTGAAVKLCAR